ncbi:hypothetical protein ACFWQC_28265 [Nocardioides sp. NPDC058538]|uniref:hypothetical protein n=1 Tax=Nocardioides sp. NPDC058538 TaxID=3346542 RepID=UPI00364A4F71
MFASIFVLLYAAHMLSDYPLQTDHQASCKANRGAAHIDQTAHITALVIAALVLA